MIDRSLSSSQRLSRSLPCPRLEGRVDAVDGEALSFDEVLAELLPEHFEVAGLHVSAVDGHDAVLQIKQKRYLIFTLETLKGHDRTRNVLIISNNLNPTPFAT